MTGDEPFDDATVDDATRDAVSRLADRPGATELSWAAIQGSAAHTRTVRRRAVAAACVALVLLVGGATAVRAQQSGRNGVTVFGFGGSDDSSDDTTTTTGPAATTAVPNGNGAIGPGPGGTACTTCTTTTQDPDLAKIEYGDAPEAGDFEGAVTIEPASIAVGDELRMSMTATNVSGHAVNVSYSKLPRGAGVICGHDLGRVIGSGAPLPPDVQLVFVTLPPIDPGKDMGTETRRAVVDADVGTITCSAVIIASDTWAPGTITVPAAISGITSATVTVIPAGPDTTTTSEPTTTVAPGP